MRNINSSKLNKQIILEKVSQITIFSTYMGISIETIQYCIDTGELICNPLRIDNHPTAGFRINNKGKLKFKDFGNDQFWGDCFDIVALIMSSMYNKQYDVNNKNDFIKILRHITLTFKDIFYGQEKDENLINGINTAINNIKNKKPIIELVVREWNNYDINYWNSFGVDIKYLNLNFIYPIDQYYINRNVNPEPKYFYNAKDPCYAYYLGRDNNGINNIKLYFPFRDKSVTRFITNCNHLEGIYNLNRDDYDIIVITKSTKDRVSLGNTVMKLCSLYGQVINKQIGVINVPHETYRLRQNEFQWLVSKLKDKGKLVSFMDNDRTGISEAIWLRNTYEIIPIIIPKHYGVKDFSEFICKYGFNNIIKIVIDTIKNIETYERKNNKFAWNKKEDDTIPF